jgi:hypothetical protein
MGVCDCDFDVLTREGPCECGTDLTRTNNGKGVIRALFENTVEFLTTPGHPPTCMSLAGAMGCSVSATPAKQLKTEIRKQNEAAIKSRLVRARKSGELPKEINVDDYTRYLSTILAGLSIQAANGSTRAELKRTAEMALRYLGWSDPLE